MLTEKELATELQLCQRQRQALHTLGQAITDWDALLEQKEEALKTLERVRREVGEHEQRFREAQLTLPGMEPPARRTTVRRGRQRKGGRKPDTQILEEIFRERGPLHVTDVVTIGQEHGISFTGKKKPTLIARDKMYNSRRFQNFGGNVWGLVTQEPPPTRNGHVHRLSPHGAEVH